MKITCILILLNTTQFNIVNIIEIIICSQINRNNNRNQLNNLSIISESVIIIRHLRKIFMKATLMFTFLRRNQSRQWKNMTSRFNENSIMMDHRLKYLFR